MGYFVGYKSKGLQLAYCSLGVRRAKKSSLRVLLGLLCTKNHPIVILDHIELLGLTLWGINPNGCYIRYLI